MRLNLKTPYLPMVNRIAVQTQNETNVSDNLRQASNMGEIVSLRSHFTLASKVFNLQDPR